MIERRENKTGCHEELKRDKARGRRAREKNSIYTGLSAADFPATRGWWARGGRAALNRFGRVIAMPPLRFHATFAATSADLPLSLVLPPRSHPLVRLSLSACVS